MIIHFDKHDYDLTIKLVHKWHTNKENAQKSYVPTSKDSPTITTVTTIPAIGTEMYSRLDEVILSSGPSQVYDTQNPAPFEWNRADRIKETVRGREEMRNLGSRTRVVETDKFITISCVRRFLSVYMPGKIIKSNNSLWNGYEFLEPYETQKLHSVQQANFAGKTWYSKKMVPKFKALTDIVIYNKENCTWSCATNGKFRFSTAEIADVLRLVTHGGDDVFLQHVVYHICNKFNRQYDAYDFPEESGMRSKVLWLRRFRKNEHCYPLPMLKFLPLKMIPKNLKEISKFLGVPSKFAALLRKDSQFYNLVLSGLIGKSFNTNAGIFKSTSKLSPEMFTISKNVIELYCELEGLFYDESLETEVISIAGIKNNYILYLCQKEILEASNIQRHHDLDGAQPNHYSVFMDAKETRRTPALVQLAVHDEDDMIALPPYPGNYNLFEEIPMTSISKSPMELEKEIEIDKAKGRFCGKISNIFAYAPDSEKMLNLIVSAGEEYAVMIRPAKTLKEFHDSLSAIANKLKKENLEVPNSSKYQLDSEDYLICKPKMTHDVVSVGEQMKICVGSYTDDIMRRACEIVVLYDNSNLKPLVCIEIRGKNIVQAKLACNAKLSTSSKLKKVILNWADKMQLSVSTRDI